MKTGIFNVKGNEKTTSNVKKVHTIYVVDDNDKLIGTLSLRRLLLTESKIFIKEIQIQRLSLSKLMKMI